MQWHIAASKGRIMSVEASGAYGATAVQLMSTMPADLALWTKRGVAMKAHDQRVHFGIWVVYFAFDYTTNDYSRYSPRSLACSTLYLCRWKVYVFWAWNFLFPKR